MQSILGKAVENSHFKIIDSLYSSTVVDIEVGNYLFLPSDFEIEGNHLVRISETEHGDAFVAKRPGIVRVVSFKNKKALFVRIQNENYVGLSENRHLEDKID